MAITNSPNMFLPIPAVGTEQGPNYAFDINACMTLIDQHDHSPGKGVQVTTAGLNINADLDFHDHNAINLNNAVFISQANPSTGPYTPVQSLFVAPGTADPLFNDLWYVDNNGTPIQLTQSGTIFPGVATVLGIHYPTAAAVNAFQFTNQPAGSDTTTADLYSGPITLSLHNASTTTTHMMTLSPPSGIASAYTLHLPNDPSLLPGASTASFFVTLKKDTTQIEGTVPTLNGITGDTTGNIAPATITKYNLASSVLQATVASFLGNGAFVVPAGVTSIIVKGVGGGGGGGAGAFGSGSTHGGGGGSGCAPYELTLDVNPAGETLTVLVGGGGGGGHGDGSGPGFNGTPGDTTQLKRGSTVIFQVIGGQGGHADGTPGTSGFVGNGLLTGGGMGGFGTPGSNGQESFTGNGGAGASNPGGPEGGGGGGGAGWGNGGSGGVGKGPTNPGVGTAGTGYGSGGGGGGGSDNSLVGGNGGAGAPGRLDIYYLG